MDRTTLHAAIAAQHEAIAGGLSFGDAAQLLAVVLSSAVSRAAEFEAERAQVEALARFEATYSSALAGIMIVARDGTSGSRSTTSAPATPRSPTSSRLPVREIKTTAPSS